MTTYIPTDDEALAALEHQRQEKAKRLEIAAARAGLMAEREARMKADSAVKTDQALAFDPAHRLAKTLAARLGDDLENFAREIRNVNFERFKAAIVLAQADVEARRHKANVEAGVRARADRPSVAERNERERVARNLGLI